MKETLRVVLFDELVSLESLCQQRCEMKLCGRLNNGIPRILNTKCTNLRCIKRDHVNWLNFPRIVFKYLLVCYNVVIKINTKAVKYSKIRRIRTEILRFFKGQTRINENKIRVISVFVKLTESHTCNWKFFHRN